jgi:pilus assembly protein CpaF
MGGLDLPLSAIRRQIATSVHLVLQQSRLADGSRRILAIAEVTGLDALGAVEVRPLFLWNSGTSETTAHHEATGFMPTYLSELGRQFGDGEGELF